MLVGKKLQDRYYVTQELGKGAFGHTYLAEDGDYRSRPLCVVKHLRPEDRRPAVLSVAQELFQREVKFLTKLGRYSNQIPLLLDSFQESDEFYLVQEWIDGQSLGEISPVGTKQTQVEVIKLLAEILEPLAFCHKEGVIHRDLKPENIMRRRSDHRLMLIDFGAVKEITQSGLSAAGSPKLGTVIGTKGFMPAEQAIAMPCLASDVYAVGMIGLQFLTGIAARYLAIDETTLAVQWRNHCCTTSEFADLLNKMVQPFPGQRYLDAASALAALQSLPKPAISVSIPAVSVQPMQSTFSFEVAELEPQVVQEWQTVIEQQVLVQKPVSRSEITVCSKVQTAAYFVEQLGTGVTLEMVKIPSGSFWMGQTAPEKSELIKLVGEQKYQKWCADELPQHRVSVASFYAGKYVITQSQYEAIMGENPSGFRGKDLPVEKVTWHKAQEFCDRLTAKTSKNYRLPSEAEWEYACRADTTTPFHFGITIDTAVANYRAQDLEYGGQIFYGKYGQGKLGIFRGKTTLVGSLGVANNFGLYDMHGNVWEWCADDWHDSYVGAPSDGSAWITGESDEKLLRGGSWDLNPRYCRSAGRNWWSAVIRNDSVGFRVVLSE